MDEEFISLGDESTSANASEPQPQTGHGHPKDKDGIIHLQLQQSQVHMNAPPQTQTQPQDNVTTTAKPSTASSAVDINANAASSSVPVEIPKGRTTESAVRLVYNNLTRESKRKLMELMQQWSQCQATRIRNQPNSYSTAGDMDLLDDSVVLVTKHGVSAEISKGSGPHAALVHASRTSSAFIHQSPTRGGKRAPTESTEPSVSLVYNNLTRESKRELMELMQQWSEWQARKQPNSTSFWVDNNQARENAAVDEDDGALPLYDREFTLGDSSNAESKKEDEKDDDWRCLNCASSSHALKDCPKPHDHVAISMARKQVKLKRKISKVIRQQNRPLKRRYL